MDFAQYIGRITKTLCDATRIEIYEADKRHRAFPVSIFYPAQACTPESGDANLLSLFSPAADNAKEIFSTMGIGVETLEALQIPVMNNAEPNNSGPYPVVLLSPGFGIDRDLYIETIVSVVQAGYVVVTLGVPYDSLFTVFPDGKVVRQAERHPNEQVQVQTREEDIRLVMEHLSAWNQEGLLRGVFDLTRVGLMGHSIGGTAVFEFSVTHAEAIQCVILLDASLQLMGEGVPDVALLNVRQGASTFEEYVEVLREEDEESAELIAAAYIEQQTRLYESLPSKISFVKIPGANHLSFSTVSQLIGQGAPDVNLTLTCTIVTFLEDCLKGNRGVYRSFLNGVNRPSNLVEIDGGGNPLASDTCFGGVRKR